MFPSSYNTDVKTEDCGNSKLGRHPFISAYTFKKESRIKEWEIKKPFFLEKCLSKLFIVYYFRFQSHDASFLGNQSRIIPVTLYCSSVARTG